MRILLVNGRVRNLGDRAIIQCMTEQLRSAFPACELIYDADEPEVMRERLPEARIVPALVDVRRLRPVRGGYSLAYLVVNAPYLALVAARYLYFWACAACGLTGSLVPLVSAYRMADLVVWAGGDYVSDVYGARYLLRLLELRLAKLMGKTVVLYAMTIGPFRDEGAAQRAGRALKIADLILARDQGTVDLLARAGVTANVRRTADCVLALRASLTPRAEAAIARLGLDRRAVGFAPIDRMYLGLSEAEYRDYEEGLAKLMRAMLDAGRQTILIAATTEDLACCREIDRRFGLGVGILDALELEPGEIKAILGGLALIVSSRMHPIIIGTGAGTPVLGVNRLPKMKDYLDMIGLGDHYLPLTPFRPDRVQEMAADLLVRNEEIRRTLAAGLAPAIVLSSGNIEHVRRLWDGRRPSGPMTRRHRT